jgi:Tol biopolymer transport system component
VTDLKGSEPVPLDTRCRSTCVGDWVGSHAISPDGTRLAFVRGLNETGDPALDSTLIAVMDLASGTVTELESTRAANPDLGPPCFTGCGEGDTEDPRWSPDGSQLVFSRSRIGTPGRPRAVLDTALFVVGADGSDLRQLGPTGLFARDAQWSPDGTQIVFISEIEVLTIDDRGKLEDWHGLSDIYTVRPDGTDLVRLTSFTAGPVPERPGRLGPVWPTWTRDGRITFGRRLDVDEEERWEVWVMDRDGSAATRLDPADAATMTGIGCVDCAYPVPDGLLNRVVAFWRPNP